MHYGRQVTKPTSPFYTSVQCWTISFIRVQNNDVNLA